MKKNRPSIGSRIAHFLKHYLVLLLLALACAVATVLLVGLCV